ncbi:hypothetical protein [Neobacillus cucumis]|uniref:hypothetical protein n=1 Tax=Neobacillus cucumis TaxID=1740721 RepID=UPI002E1C650D|nr:hypothetical protein [Neobacillus cucumis]
MTGNAFITGSLYIIQAILWIILFLQNKRKHTVSLSHIILLAFGIGILIHALYRVLNSWWF